MPSPGDILDRYTVEAVAGKGGMAVVYRVRHNQLGSLHALKVLTLPAPAIKERLLNEGRVQSQLRHPNIVTVTDVIEVEGSPGLVMEWIAGPSLADLLASRKLSLEQADHLGRDILRGIVAAHRAGLVHRDLKPANILLDNTDDGLVPKITDFGLAKVLAGDDGATATRSGVTMGTPAYMAPEQIRDSKNVDARADLFSAGAVLYELVTGQRPFAGDDTMQLFEAVTRCAYADPRSVPGLPDRMADAIDSALTAEPDHRVADAASLLSAWTGEASAASTAGPWDADLLGHVDSISSTSDEATSDPTFDWDGDDEPEAAPVVVAKTTPSSGPWIPLAVVAVLALLGLGLWAAQGIEAPTDAAEEAAPPYVPLVSDDPALQARFASGFEQLLAADLRGADRTLTPLVQQIPESPDVPLVLAVARMAQGMGGAGIDAVNLAAGRAKGSDFSFTARRARTTAQTLFRDKDDVAWERLVGESPDVLTLVLAGVSMGDPKRGKELLVQAGEADPRAVIAWLQVAQIAAYQGKRNEAKANLDKTLLLAPQCTTCLELLGRWHNDSGELEQAEEIWRKALQIDPTLAAPRFGVAVLAGRRGDRAEQDKHLALVFAETTPLSDRIGMSREAAGEAFGQGRLAESRRLLRQCRDLASEANRYSDAVLCLNHDIQHGIWLQDADATEVAVQQMQQMATQPEVPDDLRRQVSNAALFMEGLVAGLREDRATMDRVVGRMEKLETPYLGSVRREEGIAIIGAWRSRLDGDLGPVLEQLADAASCPELAQKARILTQARAEGALPAVVAGLDACTGPGGAERFLTAQLLVEKAELDPTADRAALGTLWPDADADHPLVVRMKALN